MRRRLSLHSPHAAVGLALLAAGLAGCAGDGPAEQFVAPVTSRPSVTAEQLVGRWGVGAYHRDEDRARTEKEARSQCSNPYVIKAAPNGDVIMHLADEKEPRELRIKAVDGRTFIGPEGPAGDVWDREVLAFENNSILITRFVDPEVTDRYGTMIYVRCGAAAAKPAAKRT